jgi:predicted nucleic acid-binding protein
VPLFLDTSALVKLYLREDGSDAMEELFAHSDNLGGLYISELAGVEVISAIMKNVRAGRLRERRAVVEIRAFAADYEDTFCVAGVDTDVLNEGADLLQRHGARAKFDSGDAVQLACANKVMREMTPPVYTLVASDKGFATVARAIGHQVWDPETMRSDVLLMRHVGIWP